MPLAPLEAAPAIDDAQAEVWWGERGVVVLLDHAVVDPGQGLDRVGRGLVEFEDHVGTEEKHSVREGALAVIDAKHVLAIWEGAELLVDSFDETGDAR